MVKTSRLLSVALYCCVVGSCGGGPPTPADSLPQDCNEVQEEAVNETGSLPANGSYTLYIDGDKDMPWTVYCHNMNRTTPKEYLTVDEDKNFSEASIGTGLTSTQYRRLRIDPHALTIDLLDDTFATTDVDDDVVLPDGFDFVPAGWAQFGGDNGNPGLPAEAKMDLGGTEFVFAEDIADSSFFCTVSDNPADAAASTVSVASDLASFALTATTTTPTVLAKTVADCDHLRGDDITEGSIKLQYIGE